MGLQSHWTSGSEVSLSLSRDVNISALCLRLSSCKDCKPCFTIYPHRLHPPICSTLLQMTGNVRGVEMLWCCCVHVSFFVYFPYSGLPECIHATISYKIPSAASQMKINLYIIHPVLMFEDYILQWLNQGSFHRWIISYRYQFCDKGSVSQFFITRGNRDNK